MDDDVGLLHNVQSKCFDFEIKILIKIILRALIFSLLTIFIFYLPLGDPNTQCNDLDLVKSNSQNNVVAYSYLCSIYKVMSITALTTGDVAQKTMRFTSCVVLNCLYDAKLKFYSLLEKVDRQDLCRSVCCAESEEFKDIPTQVEEKKRTICKCRGKCCRIKNKT